MSGASRAEREAAERARRVTERAIRRLDMLEWAIFIAAALLALAGGALLAWLVAEPSGWGFRPTWVVASLFLLVVSGAIALIRMRNDADARRTGISNDEDDG